MPANQGVSLSAEKSLREIVSSEIETTKQALREIKLLLDQSQAEIGRLTQKNASSTALIQQINAKLETTSREEIQATYASALDSQQRLLVLKGQAEKLQSEQQAVERHLHFLEGLLPEMEGSTVKASQEGTSFTAIVDAVEAERARLSRLMNDRPAQALSNFIVQAEIVERLFALDPEKAKAEVDALKAAALATFQAVREFINEIRPIIIDEKGLMTSVKRYTQTYKDQSKADISLSIEGSERRLDDKLEVFIFRCMQELLRNAVNHNPDMGDRLKIALGFEFDDQAVQMTVADNGKGFDSGELGRSGGQSLRTIKDRITIQGGKVDVVASPGAGCKVVVLFSCPINQN